MKYLKTFEKLVSWYDVMRDDSLPIANKKNDDKFVNGLIEEVADQVPAYYKERIARTIKKYFK